MKSIAIIGKGSSILRCKREYIEKYDEVAICGRPIFDGYEHLIGEKADYDFCNCGDPRIYTLELIKKLKIIKTYNTGGRVVKRNYKIVPKELEYEDNTRIQLSQYFKDKYKLDPSTGILAIETILRMNKYNKIGLFGFDLMKEGEPVYYFSKEEVQDSLQVYFKDGTYSSNGIRLKRSGHDIDLSYKYLIDIIKKNKEIEFEILSNLQFDNYNNLYQIHL